MCIVVSGCIQSNASYNDNTTTMNQPAKRIIGKEYTIYEGTGFRIIEIDGIEYVANSSGGICPLTKDTSNKR